VEPQRRPGKARVAALMEAAASVIAEKGYEAATMAEIAARAGALVGSLYHFFPNKEALAEALIRRYEGIVDDAFAELDARAIAMPVEELADTLVNFALEKQLESKAMLALLDARAEWLAKRAEFKEAAVQHIARTLSLKAPGLPPEAARHMAVVLLQNMKAMKALVVEHGEASGAVAELRDMTRLYLATKLRGNA
jgi:AcrR family transcriptional regulator